MAEDSTRQGKCGCGQLRYEVRGEPIIIHCCHCTYCQRETGTAFATNFITEAANVTMGGEVERIDTPSASGKGQWILRCPECKVAVSSHYASARERMHFIRVGTMEDHLAIRPDVHIYTSTKMDWIDLSEDIPAFPEFYDHKTFWSEQQMRRWMAAVKG